MSVSYSAALFLGCIGVMDYIKIKWKAVQLCTSVATIKENTGPWKKSGCSRGVMEIFIVVLSFPRGSEHQLHNSNVVLSSVHGYDTWFFLDVAYPSL